MAMTREVSRRPRGTALTGTRPGPSELEVQ